MRPTLDSCFSLWISFFFSSRRRHTRCLSDWSSDVCSSDLRCRISHPTLGHFVERREPVQQRRLLPAGPLRQQRVPGTANQRDDDASLEVELTNQDRKSVV